MNREIKVEQFTVGREDIGKIIFVEGIQTLVGESKDAQAVLIQPYELPHQELVYIAGFEGDHLCVFENSTINGKRNYAAQRHQRLVGGYVARAYQEQLQEFGLEK